MFAAFLLKFSGEEGRGRKRLDLEGARGGGGGVDNGCRRERKREGEKGKAGMHESLKSQPRSRERAGGDKGGVCVRVPKAL